MIVNILNSYINANSKWYFFLVLCMYNFKCCLHYVDNTFVLVDKTENCNKLLLLFNSVDSCIQTTHEEQYINSRAFKMFRFQDRIPVFSLRCCVNNLLFTCNHTLNWIVNGNRNFLFLYVYGAFSLCSGSQSLNSIIRFWNL